MNIFVKYQLYRTADCHQFQLSRTTDRHEQPVLLKPLISDLLVNIFKRPKTRKYENESKKLWEIASSRYEWFTNGILYYGASHVFDSP